MELVLGQAGTLVLALAIVWAFMTEKIVSGKSNARERTRGDRLEGLALRSTHVAERVVAASEKDPP